MKISFASPRILLMVGDDGIVVVPYQLAGAAPFFVPLEGGTSAQEIIDFVARYPRARLTLFADNLAQDYRSDDLPRLHFFDRLKLIERRLKQNFPLASLTASLPFKKSPHRVLMIGLHESNPVFIWAEKLRARLPDIALLPIEGARLLAQLMPDATDGWAMLISHQKSGGFRQIVTYKNDLVFTRLTPLPPDDDADCAALIALDIKASLDYLTRHGLRDPKELAVLLLMPNDRHTASCLCDLSLKSIRSLTPFDAARKLLLPFAPEHDDETADLLFAAHLLSRLRPALKLMLPDTRRVWLTQSVRCWGMLAACACLLGAVISSLWSAGDLATTFYQTQQESLRLEETQRTLAHAQAHAAPLTEPLGRMRQAVERRRIYEQQTPTPWEGLDALANSIDADVKIITLDWKKESDAVPALFTVTLRVPIAADRAETVAAFTRATQSIARAMPDYSIAVTKTPYPALPQEAVSGASTNDAGDPAGKITLQRKTQ